MKYKILFVTGKVAKSTNMNVFHGHQIKSGFSSRSRSSPFSHPRRKSTRNLSAQMNNFPSNLNKSCRYSQTSHILLISHSKLANHSKRKIRKRTRITRRKTKPILRKRTRRTRKKKLTRRRLRTMNCP